MTQLKNYPYGGSAILGSYNTVEGMEGRKNSLCISEITEGMPTAPAIRYERLTVSRAENLLHTGLSRSQNQTSS
jgi:hypothetical protein